MRLCRTNQKAKPAIVLDLFPFFLAQFIVWRSGEWEVLWTWRGEMHVYSHSPRID